MVAVPYLFSQKNDNSIKIFTYEENYPFEYFLKKGKYLLEVWGAQGGNPSNTGGEGGYSRGILTLFSTTKILIYCGEKGTFGQAQFSQTFNHGGANYYGEYRPPSGSGGGSTDIRFSESFESRIIVAGGGGGAGSWQANNVQIGGYGGGIQGGDGKSTIETPGIGASNINPNGFELGKGTDGYGDHYSGGGGGGGYYGGQGAYESGGGGGTGYVSKYLLNAYTLSGNETFEQPDGTLRIGHLGNGYARITCVYLTCNLTINFTFKINIFVYILQLK